MKGDVSVIDEQAYILNELINLENDIKQNKDTNLLIHNIENLKNTIQNMTLFEKNIASNYIEELIKDLE